eukprot:Phypoly_transcript_10816.p1 GENE.Phypoly_transcript_10816~~Phypoly_transcript_10816.p1  ORF type:complete len:321 (+),score=15.90 Phypoly_transcript_10816:102-1064(+)
MGNWFSFSNKVHVEEEEPHASWITNSLHHLGNRRLNQIALPGTHNSATYSFSRASRYAVDQPGLVKYRPPWPVSSFIAQWSKTQARTIHQQLCDGIRYFDFRVGYQDGEFYTCHGMKGDTIRDILKTFIEYANKYPREVVIIDFNHFYKMGPAEHETLTQQIRDQLGDKFWPFEHANATLDEAASMNLGPIVVVYHKPEGQRHSFYPNSAIQAPWANTDNIALLQEKLQESLLRFDRGSKQLFVSQCILTPSLDTVLRGFCRCNWSLFGLANTLNQEVVEWIAKFHQSRPLNIVMVDHYHTCNFVDLVVKLNFSNVNVNM